jgi:HlyD family secretion protein
MNRRMAGRAGGLIILAMAAGCAGTSDGRIEASGTVEATEADLGFQVPGRIDSLLVEEGSRVGAGQRLATLDAREVVARGAAAVAQLAAQRARLSELERGSRSEEIAQSKAALRAAEQRVGDAARDRNRARNLFQGGVISQQALDGAETAWALAEAERDRVREQARMLESGPRIEQVTAQRALVAAAQAVVEQADAARAFGEIRAPFPGMIARRLREPGEVVGAGMPVVTLSNPGDRWVRIYVREDEVGRVSLGQRATIRIDAYLDRTFQGEVSFIAGEAEFTPRNVQTREERVKLVYRVKVRVVGDSAEVLKPGLTADVVLEEGR